MTYLTNSFDEKVVELLKGGGIGLVPTDTIYGLSALAMDKQAVSRLFNLKRRDTDKPCIVLISTWDHLSALSIDAIKVLPAKKYWPAQLTIECHVTSSTPLYLHRGTGRFGVRMPDLPVLRELISKTGPIISTSANLQGEQPASSVDEAKSRFGDQLDFYVDFGKINGKPSTLAKIENGKFVILRQGSYKLVNKEQ